MKFAFISGGLSTFAWMRLLDEGHEVQVFNANRLAPLVGTGLVPLHSSLSSLVNWAGNSAVYIADTTTIKQEHTIDIGAACDTLRSSGKLVLCGGRFADKLENDRDFGQKVAKEIGFDLPTSKKFANLDQAIDLIAEMEGDWYFKTDDFLDSAATQRGDADMLRRHIGYIKDRFGANHSGHFEEVIDGAAMMNSTWFNGEEMVHGMLTTIELKKAFNGELGPSTGCSANIVFNNHETHQRWRAGMETFANILKKNKAPNGLYDANCVCTKDKTYFLEWTPRFGYDSEATAFQLVPDLGRFFLEAAAGTLDASPYAEQQTAGYGIRLAVPPYPEEHYDVSKGPKKSGAFGLPIEGLKEPFNQDFAPSDLGRNEEGFFVASGIGMLGVAITTGQSVRSMNREVVTVAKSIHVPNLHYRTDAAAYLIDELYKIKEAGVPLPTWLMLQ